MTIKAFLESGRFVFVRVLGFEDIKKLASKYPRWEYIS